ncbi:MAG TPA: prephenate dehydrogenase [Chloroflexota bacterium]|jgi:prephenate dehydrogenase|nr:prephenate dehydrogenase [Chloroflexota bacterium]
MERVAILGLGLIGTSLGLALQRLPRPPRVTGYDRDPAARARAASRHAIDRAALTPQDAVADTDLVVLATPVRTIIPLLGEIAPCLRPDAVVTDTGSTKAAIVAAAAERFPEVPFVGGHPMAGRLTQGTDEADAALFDGTVYCLTPTASTPEAAIARVVALVEAVGARPHFVAPVEHDGLVAAISHLPYLLASTLMASVAAEAGWPEMALLAAGSFRTMTRLVDAEPTMYADICLTNREAILRQLDHYLAALEAVREAIRAGDEGLGERFAAIRDCYRAWLRQREQGEALTSPEAELRGPSLFLPAKWQDLLLGRRPRPDR